MTFFARSLLKTLHKIATHIEKSLIRNSWNVRKIILGATKIVHFRWTWLKLIWNLIKIKNFEIYPNISIFRVSRRYCICSGNRRAWSPRGFSTTARWSFSSAASLSSTNGSEQGMRLVENLREPDKFPYSKGINFEKISE